jgi:hypothetical protein
MKTVVNCWIDVELVTEAKKRNIIVSHVLEKALITECALTDGIIKEKVQSVIDDRKKEIQMLELRIAELNEREAHVELIKNMPEVIESVEVIREKPSCFEGRLRLLQNHHIDITEGELRKLVWL